MKYTLIISAAAITFLIPACTTVVEKPVPAPVTEIETRRETHTTTTDGFYPPTTTTTETRSLRTE